MKTEHIDGMLEALRTQLRSPSRASAILHRYWRDRIAIVWDVEYMLRVANERGLALTRREARTLLRDVHDKSDVSTGVSWWSLVGEIEGSGRGRKLNRAELRRFLDKDELIVVKTT